MADTTEGLHVSDVAAIAVAATTLITTVSALAVTGALQQMQRDHGFLLSWAFACVLFAAVVWAIAALTKSSAATPAPVQVAAEWRWPRLTSFADELEQIEELLPEERRAARQRVEQLETAVEARYVRALDEIRATLPDHPERALQRIEDFRTAFPSFYPAELDDVKRLLPNGHAARAFLDTVRENITLLAGAELHAIRLSLERDTYEGAQDALRRVQELRSGLKGPGTPGLWRRLKSVTPSRRILQPAAVGLFAVGLILGLIGMIITQGEQEQPSVSAEFNAETGVLSGTATVHNLGSEGRLVTQVVGVVQETEGLTQEVRWYAVRGADADGNASQTFKYVLDGNYVALAVGATTGPNASCFEQTGVAGMRFFTDATIKKVIPQHDLAGCVVVFLPKPHPAPLPTDGT